MERYLYFDHAASPRKLAEKIEALKTQNQQSISDAKLRIREALKLIVLQTRGIDFDKLDKNPSRQLFCNGRKRTVEQIKRKEEKIARQLVASKVFACPLDKSTKDAIGEVIGSRKALKSHQRKSRELSKWEKYFTDRDANDTRVNESILIFEKHALRIDQLQLTNEEKDAWKKKMWKSTLENLKDIPLPILQMCLKKDKYKPRSKFNIAMLGLIKNDVNVCITSRAENPMQSTFDDKQEIARLKIELEKSENARLAAEARVVELTTQIKNSGSETLNKVLALGLARAYSKAYPSPKPETVVWEQINGKWEAAKAKSS